MQSIDVNDLKALDAYLKERKLELKVWFNKDAWYASLTCEAVAAGTYSISIRGASVEDAIKRVLAAWNEGSTSIRVAVESDWPRDGRDGCQGRDPQSGAKCSSQFEHIGTPHTFCHRQPHEGYCTEACFQPYNRR